VTRVGGTELHVIYRSIMATRCANIARNSGQLLSHLLQCCYEVNGYKWSLKNRGSWKYLWQNDYWSVKFCRNFNLDLNWTVVCTRSRK